jgi:hypothetical protein
MSEDGDPGLLERLNAAEKDLAAKCEEVDGLHELIEILMNRVDKLEAKGNGRGAVPEQVPDRENPRISPSRRPISARASLQSRCVGDSGDRTRHPSSAANASRGSRGEGGVKRPTSARASMPSQVRGRAEKQHVQLEKASRVQPTSGRASVAPPSDQIASSQATSRPKRLSSRGPRPALHEPKAVRAIANARPGMRQGSEEAKPPTAAEAIQALLNRGRPRTAPPKSVPAKAKVEDKDAKRVVENKEEGWEVVDTDEEAPTSSNGGGDGRQSKGGDGYVSYTVRGKLVRVPEATQAELSALIQPATEHATPTLVLSHVVGFRGRDTRGSTRANADGHVVLHGSSKGIVVDPKTGSQEIFHGHDCEIVCLAMHPDGDVVATAQAPSGR